MAIQSRVGALLLGVFIAMRALAAASPEAALDAFHQAGTDANQSAFIALLTEDAVLLGADGRERLQGQSLRDFISERFSSGRAWAFHSSERETRLSADGAVAWFDESLQNDRMGRGRGSGVMIQINGDWKIAQYDLTIPLPNGAAGAAGATPAPAASAVSAGPPESECTKFRHKTNKRAKC